MSAKSERLEIYSRRYIGCKKKLLDHIVDAVDNFFGSESSESGKKYTVADLFAGTGVVAYAFYVHGHDVIVNDTLYSNYIPYVAWMGNGNYDRGKLEQLYEKYNALSGERLASNYFSEVYAGKYFAQNDAKKIGHIREELEREKGNLTEREYAILLSSLLYGADKIANTVGHFESFLNRPPQELGVELKPLALPQNENCVGKAEIYHQDANVLVSQIKCDVLYIDPPYNARQYVNFYHVLENLARWEKPTEFEGNSMKFKRNHLKSGYSRAAAPQLMQQLVNAAKCKLIVVSYNNTYNARSGASNNKISEQELLSILEHKGKTTVQAIDYKGFNAGKTDFKNHQEKLYICEVKENVAR